MRGVLSLGLNLIFTNLYFVGTNLDLIVTMILYLDFEGKSWAQEVTCLEFWPKTLPKKKRGKDPCLIFWAKDVTSYVWIFTL